MKSPNGQPINSNPYSKHSDSDGLEDNEELHFSKEKMTYELDKTQYDGSVFVWSDPCLNDTDGDGLWDNEDPLVLKYGISNKMSYDYKEELYKEIDAQIKEDFSWVMQNKNIGYYTTKECLDIIYEYDDLITQLSNTYMIPKAIIQSVLLRELRCVDILDGFVDSAVINYFAYKYELDNYNNSTTQQYLTEPPTMPVFSRKDSSTGLGQIFAETAIKANNWAVDKKIIDNDIFDYNNWKDREIIWTRLKDNNKYNITMISIVLMWGMQEDDCLMQTMDRSFWKFSDEQIKAMLTRYNGIGDEAVNYGNETFKCYQIFNSYNKLDLK